MKNISKYLTLTLPLVTILLSGCSSPEQKEARYIKRGNDLFESGEYEKARLEYKNASKLKPTDPEVLYRLGLVEEAEDSFRAAFVDFIQAEEQNPHMKLALFKIAEYYLAGDVLDQAQKRIDVLLSDTPTEPRAHALLASLLLHKKEYGEAEKEAKSAIASDPSIILAYSVLAGVYTFQGKLTDANHVIEDGIAHNPKDLSLLILKARINEQSGDMVKLTEAYVAIFKLKPNAGEFRVSLAKVYQKMDKLDEAEATFKTGILTLPEDHELKHQYVIFLVNNRGFLSAETEIQSFMHEDPKDDTYFTWLIELYTTHDAMDKALALLQKTISEDGFSKKGINAHTALARLDYIKGDKADAKTLVTDVLTKDPNNIDALTIKARIEADDGLYDNAITALRTILRDRPKSREALQLLSETLLQQGHTDLAIETLNQYIEIDPTNDAAKVRLAQLYHINGDSKHAMSMLFLITKSAPKYPVAWETVARIAIDTKDWPTADQALLTLETLEGSQMTATYLRGQILEKSGKPNDAIPYYKKVIEADPNSSLAEKALKGLVETYQQQKHIDEAAQYLEGLALNKPLYGTVLGECYIMLNKPVLAAKVLDMVLASNPIRQDAYLDRAVIYVQSNKNEEALALLKKAELASPSDLRAFLMEADVLSKLGKYQEVIAIYDNILKHHPSLDAVANNMAETIADYDYKNSAALDKAQQAAERFSASNNPFLLDTLAWVYYRLGKLTEAQTLMEKAIGLSKDVLPQMHYHYGSILMQSGKKPEAKAEFFKAVADKKPYPGEQEAEKLLKDLE